MFGGFTYGGAVYAGMMLGAAPVPSPVIFAEITFRPTNVVNGQSFCAVAARTSSQCVGGTSAQLVASGCRADLDSNRTIATYG